MGIVSPVTGYMEKQPSEAVVVGVDWTDRLAEDENLLTVSAAATNVTDGVPAPEIIDDPFIVGKTTVVRVKNGQDKKVYKVTLNTSTNRGAIYEADILVYVVDV